MPALWQLMEKNWAMRSAKMPSTSHAGAKARIIELPVPDRADADQHLLFVFGEVPGELVLDEGSDGMR